MKQKFQKMRPCYETPVLLFSLCMRPNWWCLTFIKSLCQTHGRIPAAAPGWGSFFVFPWVLALDKTERGVCCAFIIHCVNKNGSALDHATEHHLSNNMPLLSPPSNWHQLIIWLSCLIWSCVVISADRGAAVCVSHAGEPAGVLRWLTVVLHVP